VLSVGWRRGQALRPLGDITATQRRVADRSLYERIELNEPKDEIKDLADTLDAMLDRLDRSFARDGRPYEPRLEKICASPVSRNV
jgi:nitrate/nitrite-specific signal transduction histidine kinase